MTSMSDKLSASVRKAKAQTAEGAKPEAATKPARKSPVKRANAASQTRQSEVASKTTPKAAPSKALQDELFPARIWPD